MPSELYAAIIVAGGAAELSAALVLGRCRRVLSLDAGEPRNAGSGAMHGFPRRDGIPPLELLRLGREELTRYGVECHTVSVSGLSAKGITSKGITSRFRSSQENRSIAGSCYWPPECATGCRE
jgi:thioredoxin reductase